MSDFLKIVGDRIRNLRKANGLTQEGLAEKAELQYSYIGGVERGERNISLETLEKILIALDVTAFELFKFGESEIFNELIDKKRKIEGISNLLHERSDQEIYMIYNLVNRINPRILDNISLNLAFS
ncbi:helix-turn-helix domain-containing protein [Bacillus rubiinfantis]|uniref:helix-turn-helix domain-containing protein n=1 Tax=Bacillus rubiinfantis TaxID=1499680 RepID=UPI0005A81917|nr:helix-turn-helix transcriptional regulator [Bacillus rubiinfantis]